jgi:hypothetical protein
LFQPGNNANPKGRPKGSRNKLGEQFLAALQTDFETHGVKVIKKVREERPHEYLKVVASILPKELDLGISPYDSMTDAQLKSQFLAALREAQALGFDIASDDEAVH